MIDKELLGKFTEHLTKENVRFLFLLQWPADEQSPASGNLAYWANGHFNEILMDIHKFTTTILKDQDPTPPQRKLYERKKKKNI